MARITKAQLEARIAALEEALIAAQRENDDLKTVVAHQKRELDLYQMCERPSRSVPVQAQETPRPKSDVARTQAPVTNSQRYLRVIETSTNFREVLDAAKHYAALTGQHVRVPSASELRQRPAA